MSLRYNLSELEIAVKYILDNSRSKTLLFYGEMGAGKTTLIQAFVKALGAEDVAASPTFSLVNEYESMDGPIFHFDFYRIEDESEALDMGIEDYLYNDSWKLIEWPQKIESLLEKDFQKIELSVVDEKLRMLKLC